MRGDAADKEVVAIMGGYTRLIPLRKQKKVLKTPFVVISVYENDFNTDGNESMAYVSHSNKTCKEILRNMQYCNKNLLNHPQYYQQKKKHKTIAHL